MPSLKNENVRRLRALIARGMAHPKDELELQLLLQDLYGRRDEIVRAEQKISPNPDDDDEEDD
jgi:hypothetical protein